MYKYVSLLIALGLCGAQAQAQEYRHGQVQRSADQPWTTPC